MARKEILVDDLDGNDDDSVTTISYTLGGVDYQIDLSAGNAEELRGLLEELDGVHGKLGRFTAASRTPDRTPARAAGRTRTRPVAETDDNAAVREWARDNGYTVSDRGRISAEIVAAYQLQHAAGTAA